MRCSACPFHVFITEFKFDTRINPHMVFGVENRNGIVWVYCIYSIDWISPQSPSSDGLDT